LYQRASSNIWRPPFVLRKNHPRWHPRKLARRLTRLRRQHCWPQKRARPSHSPIPPTKRLLKTTFSAPAKTTFSAPAKTTLSAPAALKDNRNLPQASPHRRARTLTEDGEVLGVSAEEQLQLRALRLKNRNLQRQKEILEAKRQRVSALAKVRQMIRDEEQKAQDLEREIALMQHEGHLGLQHGPPLQQRAQLEDIREGHLGLQHGPPLQQRAQMEDLHFPQRDHAFPHAAPFQGVNYLDERSPLPPHLQVTPWPANFRVGTYPKYNGSMDPAQYIMSYQVAVASSRGDDATMAKSFIIALEGPALTWFTRLPPLSIDS
jgi:hypothetical protein